MQDHTALLASDSLAQLASEYVFSTIVSRVAWTLPAESTVPVYVIRVRRQGRWDAALPLVQHLRMRHFARLRPLGLLGLGVGPPRS